MEADIRKEVHIWIKGVVEPCSHSFTAKDGSSIDVRVEEDGDNWSVQVCRNGVIFDSFSEPRMKNPLVNKKPSIKTKKKRGLSL